MSSSYRGGRRPRGIGGSDIFKCIMQQLLVSRYQPQQTRQQIVLQQQQFQRNRLPKRKKPQQQYMTGVYKGMYYRIPKVSTTTSTTTATTKPFIALPVIPKLYTPTSPPAKIPPILKPTASTTPTISESASIAGSEGTTSSSSSCSSSVATTAVVSTASTAKQSTGGKQQQQQQQFYSEYLLQWLYDNYGTLILNFGSICTLVGFTRSDVLELRCLSVTGSICAIIYHIATLPIRIPPLLWSATFAVVNGCKIYEIMQERQGTVQLTTEQEEIYINFFMPHGVTPKQFEMIYSKAEVLHVKKGTYIIRQTEEYKNVDLVVAGTTRASALGRFLTAASTTPTAHEERVGGASGAWIGEMCLLERLWVKEQQQHSSQQQKLSSSPPATVATPSSNNPPINGSSADMKQVEPTQQSDHQDENSAKLTKQSASNFTDFGNLEDATPASKKEGEIVKSATDAVAVPKEKAISPRRPSDKVTTDGVLIPKAKACRSMYTIVAQDDCIVLRWSHDVMEGLMSKSTDMRAALTRAMTAAIVGKVINFTISRTKASQPWTSWLGDWKYNAGAEVYVDDNTNKATAVTPATTTTSKTSQTEMVDAAELSNKENLPNYPIRSFK